MERLTDKMLTEACNDPWDYCGLDAHCTRHCTQPTPCKIPALVHRLAKIENILGDNYDLDRLRELVEACLLYTSPSPRDRQKSRMPSSA